MTEKIFKGFVILNWKTGVFRVIKKMPNRKGKDTEIPIEINLKVKIPEPPPVMKVEGELVLGETMVKKLILDSLDSGDFNK